MKSKTNTTECTVYDKIESERTREAESWQIRVRSGSAIWRSYTRRSAQWFRRG